MEDELKKAHESLDEWLNVRYRMNEEGFHYCFNGYSSWKKIKDEKFQQLRNEYLLAANRLEVYVNEKTNDAIELVNELENK